jgi:16S rRNA (cytidine1402-2'-O)-methyltransferase
VKGKLFVIPINISDANLDRVLPLYTMDVAKGLRCFVVEKIKTARQFLRKVDRTFPIDDSEFYELNKHNNYEFEIEVLNRLKSGEDVGLMSEAGYPGIADPGSAVVNMAHKYNIKVESLIGPSSIFLALATSGLNGQGFTFNGYLPKLETDRVRKIKELCQEVRKKGFAQIFIETPYRNQSMFNDLLNHAADEIKLTVAMDLTGKKEFVKTKEIGGWKQNKLTMPKEPCVFILGN